MLLGESFERFESLFKGIGRFQGGAIGAEKVVAKRSGLEDGETIKIVAGEAESLVTFEFLVFLPGFGLEKMFVHRIIIT